MVRTENDVVKPPKPLFLRRYVNDIYSRREKNCTEQLHHELNNYHPSVNLTIEILNSFLTPKLFQKMEK